MPAYAALLDSRAALSALRRTMPKAGSGAWGAGAPVVACRTPKGLRRLLATRVPEAIVLGVRAAAGADLPDLRSRWPGVPVVLFGACRPDLGPELLAWHRFGVAAVAVEGVDEAVIGELVRRVSLSARRREALADAPRLLRLKEPLQRQVWDRLVASPTPHPGTGELARSLGCSREYLSRQFAAGGAPNLKRAMDLSRVACAAQLLDNPGFPVPVVVRLLDFSSQSHLSSVARRIAGVPASGLASLGPAGVLAAFARGKTRSRR